MGILVLILIIAAIAGGVWLNRRTHAQALEGVLVKAIVPPETVAAALVELYCGGARATFRSLATGLKVAQVSRSSFRYETKHGDVGMIQISADGGGALVAASAETLFIGNTAGRNARSGWYAMAAAIVNWLFVICGIAPNAAKLRRFQKGLEGGLRKKLGAAAIPPTTPQLAMATAPAAPVAADVVAAPVDKIPATRAQIDDDVRAPDKGASIRTERKDEPIPARRDVLDQPEPKVASVAVDAPPVVEPAAAVTTEQPAAVAGSTAPVEVAATDDDGDSLWDA